MRVTEFLCNAIDRGKDLSLGVIAFQLDYYQYARYNSETINKLKAAVCANLKCVYHALEKGLALEHPRLDFRIISRTFDVVLERTGTWR